MLSSNFILLVVDDDIRLDNKAMKIRMHAGRRNNDTFFRFDRLDTFRELKGLENTRNGEYEYDDEFVVSDDV